jgi:amino acid transporter
LVVARARRDRTPGPAPAGGEPGDGEADNTDAASSGAPNPDAVLPKLDRSQIDVLRRVGREWSRVCGTPEAWRKALPVDPNLGRYPSEIAPTRFGRFVRVAGEDGLALQASDAAEESPSLSGRVAHDVRRVLLGPPLNATAIATERMRKLVALPVLSADALSSVAYGPEALLAILVLGGSAGLSYSLPIAAAIAFLMLAVGVSYRQTIRAYPHGGGSYIVATDNLGRVPGLVAAAGLLTDYVLTVAVSVASGIAAVTSAIPSLSPDVVPIGVVVIAALLAGNLRGVRQAGAIFAAPTYAFIIAIFALVIVGLIDSAGHGFHPKPTPHLTATEGVGILLVLRAFASGSTAMTGIEAISNAVPAFQPTEWRNARTTLTWMVSLLIVMFAGTIVLVHLDGVVPSSTQTVLSQLAHISFGSGIVYDFTQAATAAILLLAANTAYNDFPRVLYLLARDYQAPRLFLRIGDRLAFTNGIVVLSIIAAVIYVAFSGETAPLIPLYAVGVFLAFTLSQTGMVVHWRRHRDDRHWRRSMYFNGTGAVMSAIVFITAGVTKFAAGAWVSILTIGLFILIATRIRRYYDRVSKQMALHPHAIQVPPRPITPATHPEKTPDASAPADPVEGETEESPEQVHNLLIVPVAQLNLPSMRAMAYAASLEQPVLALHISPTDHEAERFREYWQAWGDHLPLTVIVSPHRALVPPMVNYISSLRRQRDDLTLTVIVPEIIVKHWWDRALHDRTATRLRRALRELPKLVVTSVPFHLY